MKKSGKLEKGKKGQKGQILPTKKISPLGK